MFGVRCTLEEITHFPVPYSLIIDSDVCWNSTYKTHKLLVTCHTYTTVPLNLPARRLEGPAKWNILFMEF